MTNRVGRTLCVRFLEVCSRTIGNSQLFGSQVGIERLPSGRLKTSKNPTQNLRFHAGRGTNFSDGILSSGDLKLP
jgi:hypothetical protein